MAGRPALIALLWLGRTAWAADAVTLEIHGAVDPDSGVRTRADGAVDFGPVSALVGQPRTGEAVRAQGGVCLVATVQVSATRAALPRRGARRALTRGVGARPGGRITARVDPFGDGVVAIAPGTHTDWSTCPRAGVRLGAVDHVITPLVTAESGTTWQLGWYLPDDAAGPQQQVVMFTLVPF